MTTPAGAHRPLEDPGFRLIWAASIFAAAVFVGVIALTVYAFTRPPEPPLIYAASSSLVVADENGETRIVEEIGIPSVRADDGTVPLQFPICSTVDQPLIHSTRTWRLLTPEGTISQVLEETSFRARIGEEECRIVTAEVSLPAIVREWAEDGPVVVSLCTSVTPLDPEGKEVISSTGPFLLNGEGGQPISRLPELEALLEALRDEVLE